MSWVCEESRLSWLQLMVAKLLKCGPIPKHVAFIMDGNRRFAKKTNVDKLQGHTKGFDKLSETLQWCLEMGIQEVTVYAFSIENFKRSEEEVNGLMDLAREKFKRLITEKEKLREKGVRITIMGNRSLLPCDIVELMDEAEEATRGNTGARLNVAFSYTARDEMTAGVNSLLEGLSSQKVEAKEITVERFLGSLKSGPDSLIPDMIIRTSGEARLSDFLLFQGCGSYLHFTKVLWPELSPWDLLWAIFSYQSVYLDLVKLRTSLFKTAPLSCH